MNKYLGFGAIEKGKSLNEKKLRYIEITTQNILPIKVPPCMSYVKDINHFRVNTQITLANDNHSLYDTEKLDLTKFI